ncbi:hypothetical protein ADUPG1_004847, partial [Aduncisulcus paluster]
QRDLSFDLVYRQLGNHVGFDKSGSNRIDQNVAFGNFNRQRTGGSNESGFGCGVIGLSGNACFAGGGSYVDDSSGPFTQHARNNGLGYIEKSGQVHLQYFVP